MSRVGGDAPLSWGCCRSRRGAVPPALPHRPPVAKELLGLLRARTMPELLRHSRSPTRPPPALPWQRGPCSHHRPSGLVFAASGTRAVHTDGPSGGTVGVAVTGRVLLARGDRHLCKITQVAMVTDGKQGYGLTQASTAGSTASHVALCTPEMVEAGAATSTDLRVPTQP